MHANTSYKVSPGYPNLKHAKTVDILERYPILVTSLAWFEILLDTRYLQPILIFPVHPRKYQYCLYDHNETADNAR